MYVIIDNHSFQGPNGAGGDPTDWSVTANFWTAVAARYANNTNVIYELQNEPQPQDSTLAGHEQTIFNQIRAAAPNTLIITYSSNCADSLGFYQQGNINYSNAAVGFHNYCSSDINGSLATDQAVQAGLPVVQTEGCSGGGDPPVAFENALDNAGISWFAWSAGFTNASTGISYGNPQCSGPFNITWPQD
jgi:hypothetical protein